MPATGAQAVSQAFLELTDALVSRFDVIDFLQTVTSRAAELVDAEAAGLVLADGRGRLHLMAASDEATQVLELYQVQNDEGPCLDAFTTGRDVVEDDLASAAGRWPSFVPRALEAGFSAVHAVPLHLEERVIGALNLFGSGPLLTGDQDVRIVRALTDVATVGLVQHRAAERAHQLAEQVQGAVHSRIVIEQAKGALARMRGVPVDDAFDLMREHARGHDLLLGAVARAVLTDPSSLPGLTHR